MLKAARAASCNTSEREQSAQQPTAFQKATTSQAQGARGLPALACKPHAAARAHAPPAHCAPDPQTHTNGNPRGHNTPRPSAHPHRARACRVVLEADAATRDTGASGRPLCHTAHSPPLGKPPIDNTGTSFGAAAHQLGLAPSCVACRPCLCRAALPPSPPSRASRPPLFLVRSTSYDRTIALIVVMIR